MTFISRQALASVCATVRHSLTKPKPPLTRTRKTRVLAGVVVGAIILVAAGGGYFLLFKKPPKPRPQAVKQADIPIPASPEYNYADAEFGQAIQKAQNYLSQNLPTVKPSRRLILDYLQRKYGINKQFSAQYNAVNPPVPAQQEDPVEFLAYKRIAYPKATINTLPTTDDPMSRMMVASLQCDHFALPADLKALVQSNINTGGYNLTHTEFSLKRMEENGCNYFSAVDKQAVLDSVAKDMAALIARPDTTADLRYEAIAFLMDMNRQDLVQPAQIKQIASEQLASGDWKVSKDQPYDKDDDHSTVLALWALLEYVRPNAPKEPMIRRSSR